MLSRRLCVIKGHDSVRHRSYVVHQNRDAFEGHLRTQQVDSLLRAGTEDAWVRRHCRTSPVMLLHGALVHCLGCKVPANACRLAVFPSLPQDDSSTCMQQSHGNVIAFHSLPPLPCRYTGYIQGLSETYAQTPIPAQLQTKQPPTSSFLFTRTYVPSVSTPSRDPCNFPDTYKPRHEPVNLWPQLQSKGEHTGHTLLVSL